MVMRFGYFLGLAFQIEDDLRNLSQDPGYGKEQNGDLAEAKRTLMLIHVRDACDAAEERARARLRSLASGARSAVRRMCNGLPA
jgi:geranylgeranyl diphosphate synthase type II